MNDKGEISIPVHWLAATIAGAMFFGFGFASVLWCAWLLSLAAL